MSGLVPQFILPKRKPQETHSIAKRAHANNPTLDDSEKLARRAWFFQAVGHEVRPMIFGLIEVEQSCFCDIIQTLQVPSSTVVHHLSMLEDVRVITGKENGEYTSFMFRNDLIAI
jgi:DNA-binding transcriptional ArsR family regulator